MTYREFLNSLSNEDFAQIIAEDGILNIACVSNLSGDKNGCKFDRQDCFKCILALLESDVEKEITKR